MQLKKRLLLVLLCFCCVMPLFACQRNEKEEPAKVVYKYGKYTISYGEFFVYAKTVEEDYVKAYGNGIWSLELSTDDGKSSLKEVTVKDIIGNINRVKVLVGQAEDLDITLSDKEKQEALESAETFFAGLTDRDKKETEVTKELATLVIEENMLAKKVYDKVISEHEFEISEEQARMTTFCDMVFECYRVKQDGSVEAYTDEKKATQLEKANEALATLAENSDMTYEMIIDKYDLKYAGTYTMSRGELVEEYGESITDKVLALSNDEVSVVIESEYGYHIFKMLQSKDEELTKKNKAAIIENMQKEYFNEVFKDWSKKYEARFNYEEDVNKELIGNFPFTSAQ